MVGAGGRLDSACGVRRGVFQGAGLDPLRCPGPRWWGVGPCVYLGLVFASCPSPPEPAPGLCGQGSSCTPDLFSAQQS